ncbi:glycosyltransferase family 4 protein [Parabacteroides sp. ZJ-118]|uniref:glycosyltransferase family 4 protein n=1 Tax=Parabacteroides sp. ZJ-118 TaxID=2709398 RepID=UPI0013ED0161|nr:glycosyltransferase family 4 protein [Parabacteroides sp. ZJ-118]
MFIALISRGVPSKRDPQWGCFEKDQAEALVAIGHKVVVISVDSRFRFYWRKPGISHYRLNDIDYYDCFWIPGIITRILLGKRGDFSIKRMQLKRLFNRVIREHGLPDVLYSHYLTNSYVALTLKKKYSLPLVAIEHWSQLNKDVLSDYVVWLGQSTYSKCDAIISVSESLRQRLLQHFQTNSIVIHNMVGTEFCGRYSNGGSYDKVRFVSTGSLLYGKGYDLLISAFDRIKLPLDKWELVIIGEGKERANLERQIDRVGLKNNIHLLGRKGKKEISTILCNSDVFVLPSRSENFSVAVLEALCVGLPVIASICGGIRECVDVSNGSLFPVDDVEALSSAIKDMYENCHRYDHKIIAEESHARFSPNVIAAQLTNVFQDVIENRI